MIRGIEPLVQDTPCTCGVCPTNCSTHMLTTHCMSTPSTTPVLVPVPMPVDLGHKTGFLTSEKRVCGGSGGGMYSCGPLGEAQRPSRHCSSLSGLLQGEDLCHKSLALDGHRQGHKVIPMNKHGCFFCLQPMICLRVCNQLQAVVLVT